MQTDSTPATRVLQITWVYNEADILPWMMKHMLAQGVDLLILDNWSTDGSYEIARTMSVLFPDRVSVARYPTEGPPAKVSWADLLEVTENLSFSKRDTYSWFIHQDADELSVSSRPGETVAQAITRLDKLGYTTIDHEMNIMASRDGWDGFTDPSLYFSEFCENIEAHRRENEREVKVWKQPNTRVDLVHNGGHTVRFHGSRLSPERFIKYHYSMRGKEHAQRKIASRMSRWAEHDLKDRLWHTHMPRMYKECVERTTI